MKNQEIASLADLVGYGDGVIEQIFTAELARVIRDVNVRPGVEKARSITLTVKAVPDVDDDTGRLRALVFSVTVGSKIPARAVELMYVEMSKRMTALTKRDIPGQMRFVEPSSKPDPEKRGQKAKTG